MSYFEDLSLRAIWVATSGDDGKSWQHVSEVANLPQTNSGNPGLDGRGGTTEEAFYAVPSAAGTPIIRTPDNQTLVAIEHQLYIHPPAWDLDSPANFWRGNKPDSGARAALVVLDYIAAGVAEPDQGSVVFKRTKPNLI